jgi:hypothetical protein
VPGDAQDPGPGRLHGGAAPQLRDRGQKRLLGQILSQGDLGAAAAQEVPVDARQGIGVEDPKIFRIVQPADMWDWCHVSDHDLPLADE